MFKSFSNIILTGKLNQIIPVQIQSLRWKRKPRKPFWLGTAKSKIFRIHEDPILPPEEKEELFRLHSNYKSAMKAIRGFYKNAIVTQSESSSTSIDLATPEEIAASYKVNEEWNAECAKMREKRLIIQDKQHEEEARMNIENKERAKSELQRRVEALVKLEKERSHEFITRDNLDAKIEECLDSTTDYNYAIDLEGNIYTGFEQEMKASPREKTSGKESAMSS